MPTRNPLIRLESLLERAVETPVARVFGRALQPAEIGRALEREMRARRILAVDRPIAPNRYVVRLNARDLERFAPVENDLRADLESWLEIEGGRQGFRFLDRVEVVFEGDDSIEVRDLRVNASTARQAAHATPGQILPEVDAGFTRPLPEAAGRSTSRYLLTLIDGPQAGRQFLVNEPVSFVGRDAENTIVLPGADISRRHARFEVREDLCRVVDLSSTNGTYVNGRQVPDWALVGHGDRIAFGTQSATLVERTRLIASH